MRTATLGQPEGSRLATRTPSEQATVSRRRRPLARLSVRLFA